MFVRFRIFGNIVIEISGFLGSLGYPLDIVVLISSRCPLDPLSSRFKRLFTHIFLALLIWILVDERGSFTLVDKTFWLGLGRISLSLDSLKGFKLKALREHLVNDGDL